MHDARGTLDFVASDEYFAPDCAALGLQVFPLCASKQRWNTLKEFEGFHQKAEA